MNQEQANQEKKGKGKLILVLILTLALAVGAGTGIYFVWQGASYLTTDNARVTTTLISITPPVPGTLERFTIYEGRYVEENEILGWVENGEAIRSPINGIVVRTLAVRDQTVSPHEPLALIADINGLHIQANIEETDIARIQLGQTAIVTIDGFGSRQFSGYVSEIGHATQAELTGSALFFNTGGTFTRVTHLIPIKITVTDEVNLDSFIGVNARVRLPLRQPAVVQPFTTPAGAGDGISVRGTVESVESRNIYTTLGFMVERVYVKEGDRVTAGQTLGTLDTGDLALTIAQQRASLETARQSADSAVFETQRMLREASANLANNTNIHILSAEAALNAAETALTAAQKNYNDAVRDHTTGSNTQAARIELETRENAHANALILHAGGIISQDELRQTETALTLARNQYNDATEVQQRTLERVRIALQSAVSAHQNAQELFNASRIAAGQDIARLRDGITSAEIASNLEHMELALQLLEKQLEDSVIRSPIDGTVTAVIAREGAVGMGLLFVIEDTDSLKITTRFREYDIGRIETGMAVIITSNATGNAEYAGIISRINPAAAAAAPIVEFEAEVTVTSAETGLRIGMNARVDVVLEH